MSDYPTPTLSTWSFLCPFVSPLPPSPSPPLPSSPSLPSQETPTPDTAAIDVVTRSLCKSLIHLHRRPLPHLTSAGDNNPPPPVSPSRDQPSPHYPSPPSQSLATWLTMATSIPPPRPVGESREARSCASLTHSLHSPTYSSGQPVSVWLPGPVVASDGNDLDEYWIFQWAVDLGISSSRCPYWIFVFQNYGK